VTQVAANPSEEQLRVEFEDASRDAAFLRDVEDTMCAFAGPDAETARLIPE
jgi:hypothetical protein